MKKYPWTTSFMLPFLLLGCSNTSNNKSHNQRDDENCFIKEDTDIHFLCLSDKNYNEILKNIIAEFKEVEPHVNVFLSNPLGTGNYSNLENIVVAGFLKEDYPDIVQCYPDNVVKYISRGYAVNLDTYLNSKDYGLASEQDDYISSFIEEGRQYTVSGTYSLPFCKSTELMYYNADVLEGLDLSSIDATINNGLPLDEAYLNSLTWEELFNKLCPAIKDYNENVSPLIVSDSDSAIFTYDSDENFFITLANQYGYGYTSINEQGKGTIDFDNSGMKNCMKMLNSAMKNGFLQTKYSLNDYVSSLFVEKKCLFTVSSTAGLSYNYNHTHPFKVGVAKIPHASGKNYSSINQGPSVCVLDHKDENRSLAAYLFWKHMTSKTNSTSWALATGYMGIRNSTYTSDEYMAALNVTDPSDLYKLAMADNLKRISDVKESTFVTAVFRGSSNARKNVGLLLRDCILADSINDVIDQLFKDSSDDAKKYLD